MALDQLSVLVYYQAATVLPLQDYVIVTKSLAMTKTTKRAKMAMTATMTTYKILLIL